MEKWMKKVVEEARSKYGPVEVKNIGNNYYLSKVSSVYDPEKKRARKISGEYIGKITPSGVVRAVRRSSAPRSVYEYGNAKLLYDLSSNIIDGLKSHFPSLWREAFAMSVVRSIRHAPMKYMDAGWDKLYLSSEMEASMSPSILSSTLRSIGRDWESQRSFFRDMMKKGDTILFDISSIFSNGENVLLAEKGYNRHRINLRQINFAMAFSRSDFIPTVLKPLPGSVRDVKSLISFLREFDIKNSILVLDRGFFSYHNIEYFLNNDIDFIQPLSRSSKIIDYSVQMKSVLTYRNRGIRHSRVDVTGIMKRSISIKDDRNVFLYLYEDVKLRGEEESNLILLLSDKRIKKYDGNRLGKISILSSLDMDGGSLYSIYKSREDVEQSFDAMKNELEEDKTYLQDDESIWGYFFVTFLSLYQHYRVLSLIRSKDLVGKLSVNEVLLQLSRVYLVKYSDGTAGFLEIPKRVEDMIQSLDLNILPKS